MPRLGTSRDSKRHPSQGKHFPLSSTDDPSNNNNNTFTIFATMLYVYFDKSRRKTRWHITMILHSLFFALLTLSTPAAAWSGGKWRGVAQGPLLPYGPLADFGKASPQAPPPKSHEFTLRHIFHRGSHRFPDLDRRLDVDPKKAEAFATGSDDDEYTVGPFRARSSSLKIQRLADRKISDIQPLLSAARIDGTPPPLPDAAWILDDVAGPNITDKDTVVNLAVMAANAYDETRSDAEWEHAKKPFNYSSSFGWQKDGIRGHIFADETNSTIVISLKGTSPAVFDGAETTTNDKENDNLFFGCCCGQGGQYLWRPVCDCMTSAYTCNDTCVIKAMKQENRYYKMSIELLGNVTELYPDSDIWLVGHSLGGAVTSLLGLTFGLPVVTFEAPGDALAASRLGLPPPPGYDSNSHQARMNTGAFHFGHTADPIYMGSCNAATSACTLGGYAMQSVCHTGHRCVYDVVTDKNWRVSITTHKIRPTIKNVYRAYNETPQCVPDDECVDCASWKRYRSNGSEPITSTTSKTSTTTTSTPHTRTETCKTPGWWGCLDETTTTTSTLTSTITTTTCSSYGWFGKCLDPITTTTITTITTPLPVVTTTSSSSSSSSSSVTPTTTTCETPGRIYGCRDKTTTIPSTTSSSGFNCETPGYIYGCRDQSATTTSTNSMASPLITSPPSMA